MTARTYAALASLWFPLLACSPRRGPEADAPEPRATASAPEADADLAPPRPAATPFPRELATFAGWAVRPGDDGTFAVGREHAELLQARHVVFGPRWQWAAGRVHTAATQPEAFSVASRLPVQILGRFERESDHELAIRYQLLVAEDLQDISGIGVEMALHPESPAWPVAPGPAISADEKTLTLRAGEGEDLIIELESPKGRIYFERGNEALVRAMFAAGDLPRGRYEVTLRVRLPAGGKVLPPLSARYGPTWPSSWPAGTLVWNDWPVDVRGIGGAGVAGEHGRVRARGSDLVFEDGTPARFWGTNIAAYTLFVAEKSEISTQAERLAALGFNLVRLHHHDSHWQQTNVFDRSRGTTQMLDDRALDNLDWWAKELAARGIYLWVDVHVGRQFTRGDGIPGFEDLHRAAEGQGKGFNYLNDRIEALMERFATEYLTRKNRYTGRTWASDPAVVGVLVTNENDLVDHMGNLFTPDKHLEHHRARFESLATGIARAAQLPLPAALQTWQPGAPKQVLSVIQHRFDERALAHLRGLGVEAPIATTNFWGFNGLWALAPLAAGDIVDVHSYGESEALGRNPRYAPTWIHYIAGAQLAGLPLSVTEWSVPQPHADRFTAPPYIAAVGSLQGWDALMLYCYSQDPVRAPQRVAEFSTWIDPSLMALAPAMAVMFRRGDVSPARETIVLQPNEEELYGSKRNAATSAAIRTAAERSRVVLDLPETRAIDWLRESPPPTGANVVADLDHDFLDPGATAVVSDTGELRRDWARGIQTIDSPRSQLVSGWIGGERIETADATFEITTPKAVVALTALDEHPLSTSERILVTVVARSIAVEETGTYRAEPVTGRIALRNARPLVLRPLGPRSRGSTDKTPILAGTREGEAQVFALPSNVPTHWYVLEPARGGT